MRAVRDPLAGGVTIRKNSVVASDELWDVTDAEGSATGRTYRRGDPDWPTGAFHVVAATCVYRDDGTVLLTQRAAAKDFPLAWEFPGGSALAGESTRTAASRELREETGLLASPEALTLVGRFTEASALFDFYVTLGDDDSGLSLDPSEVMAAEWVTIEEVDRRRCAGLMATPWSARLEALWASTLRSIHPDHT